MRPAKLIDKLNSKLLRTDIKLKLFTKTVILGGSVIFYALCFVFLSDILMVSTNYFVLIPMFFAAALFGIRGGIISGVIALPMNLLLFWLFGKLSYAPESKLIAQIFGTLTGFVLGYLSSFYSRLKEEIAAHRRARQMLDKSLAQKQLLIKEIHHRIKNNLAIIKGIVDLELYQATEPAQHEFLEHLAERIKSISVTQDMLYNIEDISTIRMDTFLQNLLKKLKITHSTEDKGILLSSEFDHVCLDIDKALPIGLIVHESCTNSIKYAFDSGGDSIEPRIHVSLHETGNACTLSIKDNGRGIGTSATKKQRDSLGISLMEKIAVEIDGNFSIIQEEGTEVEVVFEPSPKGRPYDRERAIEDPF